MRVLVELSLVTGVTDGADAQEPPDEVLGGFPALSLFTFRTRPGVILSFVTPPVSVVVVILVSFIVTFAGSFPV